MKRYMLVLAVFAALSVSGCSKGEMTAAGDKAVASAAKTEAAAHDPAKVPIKMSKPAGSQVPAPAPAAPEAAAPEAAVPEAAVPVTGPVKVVIQTNVTDIGGGVIEMELYPDKAPKSVDNFVKLAEKGFYDGILFHRVVPGFVIQGGDPLTKDPSMRPRWGSGGPGYQFPDEPVQGEYVRGAVAMANSGPNTNGSQFFICVNDLSNRLPKQYNWFGMVTKGMDVVDAIVAKPRDRRDCPSAAVVMQKVTIVR